LQHIEEMRVRLSEIAGDEQALVRPAAAAEIIRRNVSPAWPQRVGLTACSPRSVCKAQIFESKLARIARGSRVGNSPKNAIFVCHLSLGRTTISRSQRSNRVAK
jgi:hypothetical protein